MDFPKGRKSFKITRSEIAKPNRQKGNDYYEDIQTFFVSHDKF